jgi:glycosyltransferase involved in cell wall biosynthesis
MLNDKQLPDSIPVPFFSVVIATYNREKLLPRALNSLFSQTEKNWEAIIVDDESTDQTYVRILPYLGLCPNLRYIQQAHSGEPITKNTGIWAATGKFVTFLDSDDEYAPSHLESRKTILLQHPEVKFLYGGATILGNQYVPDRFDQSKKINLNNCAIGGTFFVEKDLLISLNGLKNIYLGTDADLLDRAKNAGIHVLETKLPTYIYHHETEDSITNKIGPRCS